MKNQNLEVSQTQRINLILEKLSKSDYQIYDIIMQKDVNGKTDGTTVFAVDLSTLFLSMEECYTFLSKELQSAFIMNFIGELFVRANLEKFLDIIMNLSKEEYDNAFDSSKTNVNFGVFLEENSTTMQFMFHLSLVQSLITEDCKIYVQQQSQ